MNEPRRLRGLGLRRELLILLPVALLLLVVLSTFALFSFRRSLGLIADERRAEAAHLAGDLADRLADAGPSPSLSLRDLAPSARGVALLDGRGNALATAGELPTSDLLAPLAPVAAPERPVAVGPNEALPDVVAGFAPLGGPRERRYVRVDLSAAALAGQERALDLLSYLVLSINGALVVLVLLFLRHLLEPWEALLARAREVTGDRAGEGEEGEMEFLVGTFERALTALAARGAGSPEDDIAALERTLSSSLQSGLLLLDREGQVLALNSMGAALLGTSLPEPGTPLAEVLAGQPELLELLAAAVAEGTAPRRQECTVTSGGETRTLGLTLHTLRSDDGGVRGHLVLFADLTEVRQHAEEARLAESLARLGEMAGGVAHELRNSLATLRGYLTLIERRPDEGSIADFLSEIRHEADHLERVLEDFLSFARPGTARFQEVSLGALAARSAADPALAAIPVRLRLPPGDVVLRGDPQLLERALRNLLHNAAQAEHEAGGSGPIELSLETSADGAELAVEDRGPGLSPEMRERLFHPFATGRRGGVGLGLALAHRIVVLHGGRIRLDDRPGGGTRAVLSFPRDTMVTAGNNMDPAEPSRPAASPLP
jgi:signal transduction histidine kinase